MNKIITDIDSFYPFLQFNFVKTSFHARKVIYEYKEDNGFTIQCAMKVTLETVMDVEQTLERLLDNRFFKLISISIFSKRGNSFYVPED